MKNIMENCINISTNENIIIFIENMKFIDMTSVT